VSAKSENSRPSLMSGLAEQSGRVAEEVHELGRVAMANAGKVASHLRQKSRHAVETGVKGARKAKGQLDELIGSHPIRSILIALGVGAVIGFALRRKS